MNKYIIYYLVLLCNMKILHYYLAPSKKGGNLICLDFHKINQLIKYT